MEKGILYLVGTPIGNLSDISPRALEILMEADLIAAEDTRRTAILLNRYKIKKPLESYHHFNKEQKGSHMADRILAGSKIALVSDAGMPCISDPGSELVALCADAGVPVVVVPGPCAAIAALSGSGLDSTKFVFEGFLPSSGKERKERLAFLRGESRTMVFYEAPHRIRKTLKDFIKNDWSDRRITFARELTKVHEEFIRITVGDAEQFYTTRNPRGEYVIVLEGIDACRKRNAGSSGSTESSEGSGSAGIAGGMGLLDSSSADRSREVAMDKEIERLMTQGKSIKEISVEIAAQFSIPKKQAYAIAQQVKDQKSL